MKVDFAAVVTFVIYLDATRQLTWRDEGRGPIAKAGRLTIWIPDNTIQRVLRFKYDDASLWIEGEDARLVNVPAKHKDAIEVDAYATILSDLEAYEKSLRSS